MENSNDLKRELSELNKAFNDNKIFSASDEDLNRLLRVLCSGNVMSDMANRCQVINTIKTFRFFESIQRTNKKFTFLNVGLTLVVILLTIINIGLTFYATRQSNESGKQIERLISTQEKRTIQQKEYFEAQLQEQKNTFETIIQVQNRLIESLVNESTSNKTTQEGPSPSSLTPK